LVSSDHAEGSGQAVKLVRVFNDKLVNVVGNVDGNEPLTPNELNHNSTSLGRLEIVAGIGPVIPALLLISIAVRLGNLSNTFGNVPIILFAPVNLSCVTV
jgi:hypothetical protein